MNTHIRRATIQSFQADPERSTLQLLFLGGGMLLAVLMYLWWQTISRPPNIVVPMPKLPTPNAHDDFVAAGNALLDESKISWAILTRHAGVTPNDHPYTLAQQEALVAENAGALKQLQQGLHEANWARPIRWWMERLLFYNQFRAMARLLLLKQQVEAKQGDWNVAMQTGLDCIQMGEQIPHGAPLIGSRKGIACEAVGRQEMWSEVDHLNTTQARAAAKRLETILAQHFPYERTLQEHEWYEQAALQEVFSKPGWQKHLTSLSGTPWSSGDGSVVPEAVSDLADNIRLAMHGGPRAVLYNYTRYLDALRDHARQRYGTHPSLPPVPKDPISQSLAPVCVQAEFQDVVNQAEDQLLLVTLALRAYYVEHGRHP